MVVDRKALGADVPEFVLNRMQMQDEHMETIRAKFDGRVRAVVPLFDQELRGPPCSKQRPGRCSRSGGRAPRSSTVDCDILRDKHHAAHDGYGSDETG